jgi:hypothetical protein
LLDGGIRVLLGDAAQTDTKPDRFDVDLMLQDFRRLFPTTVYVRASVLVPTTGICFAGVTVDLMVHARVSLPHQLTGADLREKPAVMRFADPTFVSLISNGRVLSGPSATFGDALDNDVRRFVDSVVTRIKLANQR